MTANIATNDNETTTSLNIEFRDEKSSRPKNKSKGSWLVCLPYMLAALFLAGSIFLDPDSPYTLTHRFLAGLMVACAAGVVLTDAIIGLKESKAMPALKSFMVSGTLIIYFLVVSYLTNVPFDNTIMKIQYAVSMFGCAAITFRPLLFGGLRRDVCDFNVKRIKIHFFKVMLGCAVYTTAIYLIGYFGEGFKAWIVVNPDYATVFIPAGVITFMIIALSSIVTRE